LFVRWEDDREPSESIFVKFIRESIAIFP